MQLQRACDYANKSDWDLTLYVEKQVGNKWEYVPRNEHDRIELGLFDTSEEDSTVIRDQWISAILNHTGIARHLFQEYIDKSRGLPNDTSRELEEYIGSLTSNIETAYPSYVLAKELIHFNWDHRIVLELYTSECLYRPTLPLAVLYRESETLRCRLPPDRIIIKERDYERLVRKEMGDLDLDRVVIHTTHLVTLRQVVNISCPKFLPWIEMLCKQFGDQFRIVLFLSDFVY